ncbi:MAG: DUF3703 domain-containing protein [Salinimicrobium sp.]
MRFNTKIPKRVKYYYLRELVQYRCCMRSGNFLHAWHHLERAHVIGQAYPLEHSYSHWLMLKFGFEVRDLKETLGQIPRLLFGGIKSFLGYFPTGNTGGANVPPQRRMEIPPDIQQILKLN